MLKTLSRGALLCLMAGILLLSGCQAAAPKGNPPVTQRETSRETQKVTDYLGRTVDVPVKADRIGCLYAISGHAVTMLGKGENIVAVVEGLKRDLILREINPQIAKADVPKSGEAVNIEELVRLNPDVVFIQSITAKNAAEMEKFAKFNIPVLTVDYRNMAEQQASVRMIGQATGTLDRAEEYIKYYQGCVDRVAQKIKDIPLEKRIRVYHSVNEATRTDARDTLPADWMQAAGAVNVSVDQSLRVDEDKYYAGMEQILQWDPDVILVNEEGVDKYILSNEHWVNLKAVKDKKVYKMSNGISRWGHPGSLETPLAVLWTAKALYPALFQDLDMVKETKFFYEKFFNFTITEETAKQILRGEGMREAKK